MSKFVKVSDVKQTLLEMSKEKTRSVGWGDVLMERLKDLSIEVSEDCISRAEVLSIISDCQDINDKAKYNTLAEVFNKVLNAPSVVQTTEQSCDTCKYRELYECSDCRFASKWERIEE